VSLATNFICFGTVKILRFEGFFAIRLQYPTDTPRTKHGRYSSDPVAIGVSVGTEFSAEHTDHVG
jgi:hypothetical protein